MSESSPCLRATAEAYDAVAVLYSDLARDDLGRLPLDRAVLRAFADSVRAAGSGTVGELGCGPGHVTAHLRDLGLGSVRRIFAGSRRPAPHLAALSGTSEYAQYEDDPPPCDARHRTPLTDPRRPAGHSLNVFGLDLSPVMIGLARQEHPGLRFEVGSMDAMELADGELGGIVSWYSLIHTAPRDMPAYLAEFRRVLADAGLLLLAFFESEGGPVTTFDHKVITAYRWPVGELAALAREAGFAEVGRMLREPCEGERFRRGHLLMRAE